MPESPPWVDELDKLIAQVIPSIYGQIDARRSIWDVWMHVGHHAAELSGGVRQDSGGESTMADLADLWMWLLTLAERVSPKVNVDDVEVARDPRESVATVSRPVGELVRQKVIDANPTALPTDLDDWPGLLPSNARYGAPGLSHDLLEALGSLGDSINRMGAYHGEFEPEKATASQASLEQALANALLLLFGLSGTLLRAVPNTDANVSLSTLLLRRYHDDSGASWGCRHCHSARCTCPVLFVPDDIATTSVLSSIDTH